VLELFHFYRNTWQHKMASNIQSVPDALPVMSANITSITIQNTTICQMHGAHAKKYSNGMAQIHLTLRGSNA